MPAAKPLPLEDLAFCKELLDPTEFAERWRRRTGYWPLEIVPIPKSLMLLSGTTRPARARERITGYLRFGILVVDHHSLAKKYKEAVEDNFEELIPTHTRRYKFSPAEIRRFFETLGQDRRRPTQEQGLIAHELLHWTRVFAETRKTMRQAASARSGFLRRSEDGKKSKRNSLDT
jgi:hypothetical protein